MGSHNRKSAARDQMRAETMPAIARLARSRDFRLAFAGDASARHFTIIPALPDDTVGYVLDRLDDAGGTAALVLHTGGQLRIATLGPASQERLAVAVEDDRVAEVHETSQVDMLFAYLERVGSAVVRRVATQLVGYGPLPVS